MKCRHCGAAVTLPMVDLGTAPPSNAYLSELALCAPERWYPLRVLVCENCWLVQTEDFAQAEELFDVDYAYFSSFSSTWLAHAQAFVADMAERFASSTNACNDIINGLALPPCPLSSMRLTTDQIEAIKQTAHAVLGDDSRVILFGSRVDDTKKGGDIDLLFETDNLVGNRAIAVGQLYVALIRRLGDRKIDILLKDIATPAAPVLDHARQTGIQL